MHFGAGIDVAGFRLEEVEVRDINEALQAYPRLDFAKVLLESIARVVREKPQAAAFNFAADVGRRFVPTFEVPDFCDLVMSAPFSE